MPGRVLTLCTVKSLFKESRKEKKTKKKKEGGISEDTKKKAGLTL